MGIVKRLGNALRALRGHSQPCQTCKHVVADARRDILDLQTWSLEWDARLTDTLEKLRAQYARERGRDKAMTERVVERVLTELRGDGGDGAEGFAPINGPPASPEQAKQELRRKALAAGMIGPRR